MYIIQVYVCQTGALWRSGTYRGSLGDCSQSLFLLCTVVSGTPQQTGALGEVCVLDSGQLGCGQWAQHRGSHASQLCTRDGGWKNVRMVKCGFISYIWQRREDIIECDIQLVYSITMMYTTGDHHLLHWYIPYDLSTKLTQRYHHQILQSCPTVTKQTYF